MNKKNLSYFFLLFSLLDPSFSWAQEKEGTPKKDDLLKNLPSSWEATILDKPIDLKKILKDHKKQAGQAGTNNGDKGTNNMPKFSPTSQNNVQNNKNINGEILIPIPPHVGIAAYHSGNEFIIVLDQKTNMDISALRGDGIFQNLSLENIFNTTLIRIPLMDDRDLYLSQVNQGWILGDKAPKGYSYDSQKVIFPKITDKSLLYPLERPGRVVTITDPVTGTNLLVGTTVSDSGGILSFRKGQNYDVWESVEGIVIAPHTNNISLKATPDGDILKGTGDQKLPDLDKAVYATDVDYDWLGLRAQTPEEMRQRYYETLREAADSPPSDRFKKRIEVAKAALNMGAAQEALSILNVALNDNPEGAMSPKVRFLLAVSELLAGKYKNADFLEQDWPDNEKRALQLWKGLYLNKAPFGQEKATPLLARDFDRLKSYPQPIREVLLPDAAENIAKYGNEQERVVLDDIVDDKKYQFIKALNDLNDKDRQKETEAYNIFKKLSQDKDILQSEKAYEEMTKLDLKNNKIDPKTIAENINEIVFDARLTGREDNLKLLQSQAYMQAGLWNDALTSIDHLKTLPKEELFKVLALIALEEHKHNDNKSLLKTAASIESHLNNFPNGSQKGKLLLSYGGVLKDLGLWQKAVNVYSDAIPMLDSPSLRGKAGAELANVSLNLKKPDDAILALQRTADPVLPEEIRWTRNRLMAVAELQKNNQIEALGLLDKENDFDSLLLKASIHEKNNEWEAALIELKKAVIENINSQTLNKDQENLILRYATDATHINDDLALSWIYQFIGNKNMTEDTRKVFLILTKQKKLFSNPQQSQ